MSGSFVAHGPGLHLGQAFLQLQPWAKRLFRGVIRGVIRECPWASTSGTQHLQIQGPPSSMRFNHSGMPSNLLNSSLFAHQSPWLR